ncbi:MAG: hypothetical protein FGM15_09580 [Chthoniobacterales bacterium]|nr:hypothetical protein [Chthoniobacterales bacterium]
MTRFEQLIPALSAAGVEFILIGGLAAVAHSSSRATYDVDVVYRRSPGNIARLCEALTQHSPRLRGAPAGLPFILDPKTVAFGLNFTLTTALGDLDLFGEIPGGRTYEELLPDTEERIVFGHSCRVVTLDKLLHLKRSTGRAKDLEVAAELEEIRHRKKSGEQ